MFLHFIIALMIAVSSMFTIYLWYLGKIGASSICLFGAIFLYMFFFSKINKF